MKSNLEFSQKQFASACAIGIDLGGTCIKYALISAQGDILFSDEAPTEAKTSRDTVLQRILAAIDKTLTVASQLELQVTCVGLGSPGTVDIEAGQVKSGANNITGWHGFPLREHLVKRINLPVYIDNDANLIAVGESVYGIAQEKMSSLVVTLGTGIGGAILMEGKLLRGTNNASAEFGCMALPFHNAQQELDVVSWESLASAKALVARFQQLSELDSVFYQQEVNGRFLFAEFHNGNKYATKAIDENARWLGVGIASLINIFNPDQVVIGGGISEAGEFYIEKIRQQVFKVAEVDCSANVEIVAAALGNKAGVLGAAYMAMSLTA